MGKEVI